jgi:glycosyltransferase involved in cell wall biosynthesis
LVRLRPQSRLIEQRSTVKPPILYISYDGMLEPLGQSQVLAYLERLAPDFEVYLISFEKASDWKDSRARAHVTARMKQANIRWHPLRYHKKPTAPATGWDIAMGTLAAARLVLQHRIRLIHARSYVPALMALPVKKLGGARLLFDIRGLWADERVDGGLWPAQGRLYKTAKAIERALLLESDHVVTLTHASAREIEGFPYLAGRTPSISVIPTCADLERFAQTPRTEVDPFTFGCVGSVSTWSAFDNVLACYRMVAEQMPGARLLIVNRHEHDFIRSRLQAHGINEECVELVAAAHDEVPALIRRMTVGAALYKPSYSVVATAPTKLAEYLGCGIPCLGNSAVGDVETLLEGGRVGVALKSFAEEDVRAGVGRLLALLKDPTLSQRCVAFAHEHFSVNVGATDYRLIYQRLLHGA